MRNSIAVQFAAELVHLVDDCVYSAIHYYTIDIESLLLLPFQERLAYGLSAVYVALSISGITSLKLSPSRILPTARLLQSRESP